MARTAIAAVLLVLLGCSLAAAHGSADPSKARPQSTHAAMRPQPVGRNSSTGVRTTASHHNATALRNVELPSAGYSVGKNVELPSAKFPMGHPNHQKQQHPAGTTKPASRHNSTAPTGGAAGEPHPVLFSADHDRTHRHAGLLHEHW